MEQKKIPVTVIIPTYNRFLSLQRTIDLILEQNTIPGQIIIIDQTVDKSEREKTQSYLKTKINIVNVEYIYQAVPSLTLARNTGMQYAVNDIIIFLDDDVDVKSTTFSNIYKYLKDPHISMIGAIDETLAPGGGMIGVLFGMKSYKYRNQGYVTKAMLGRYPDSISGIVPTMWAMGFCFAIKKSLAQKWNITFDEKLTGYAYSEDLDFTFSYYKHSRLEGLKCILSEDIKVKHLESKEYRIPQIKNTYKYVINRKYLCYKHKMGFQSRIMCRWANFGQFLFRLKTKAAPLDIIKAQIRCDKLNGMLKQGIIQESFSEPNYKEL